MGALVRPTPIFIYRYRSSTFFFLHWWVPIRLSEYLLLHYYFHRPGLLCILLCSWLACCSGLIPPIVSLSHCPVIVLVVIVVATKKKTPSRGETCWRSRISLFNGGGGVHMSEINRGRVLVQTYDAETKCCNDPSNVSPLITDTIFSKMTMRCSNKSVKWHWNGQRKKDTEQKSEEKRKKSGKCSERLNANQREREKRKERKERKRGSNTTSPSGETWILSYFSFSPFVTPGSSQSKPAQKASVQKPVHKGDRSMPSEWRGESDWFMG